MTEKKRTPGPARRTPRRPVTPASESGKRGGYAAPKKPFSLPPAPAGPAQGGELAKDSNEGNEPTTK
ncbi:hypothetical protein [Lentzea sp. NPDC059081]|uniref:hypothetical protein n=1 Tax=Lentzea sp. NPDC059081 TaxID=3346719 RepID=UPI0036837B1D